MQRLEKTYTVSQKDFLKRLGFCEDAVFIAISTISTNDPDEERRIAITVNEFLPDKKAKP